MLLVSGSSLGEGIIDISNDEGWSFNVYSSGTAINIDGNDMDVNVWINPNSMANIQWGGRMGSIRLDGWEGGTSLTGTIYPVSSGIREDETTIEFDPLPGISALGGYGYTGYHAFVGGFFFYYSYSGGIPRIHRVEVLSGTEGGSKYVELPYRMYKFCVLDKDTVYAELSTGEYINTNSLYKIDLSPEGVTGANITRLYTYAAEDEELGADGDTYTRYTPWEASWCVISKYQDKKYYVSLNSAYGYQYYARLFIYDIVNERFVSNDYIEFNERADFSSTSADWDAKPCFYEDKVVFTISAYSSSDEDDVYPPDQGWELPYPTIIFNMTTENVTRISAGGATIYTDWYFFLSGNAVDKETGYYYFSIYEETGGTNYKVYRINLNSSPGFPVLVGTFSGSGDTITIHNGIKSVYMSRQSDNYIFKAPSLFSSVGTIRHSYWIWKELFFDESINTVWSMKCLDTPSYTQTDALHVYGDGIDGGSDKIIHLNYGGPAWHYEHRKRCTPVMFGRGIFAVWLRSQQYDPTVPPYTDGLVQSEMRLFKKRGT